MSNQRERFAHEQTDGIRVVNSITEVASGYRGVVVVAGSHCGTYSGYVAATAGLRGVILNDAGIGCDEAGISGLAYLDTIGVAAAAVDYRTARIGRGDDMLRGGVLSRANRTAAALGCRLGQPCREAARLMLRGTPPSQDMPPYRESRLLLKDGPIPTWGLDSVSLVQASDKGSIVISGSHGGLLGGRPETAIKIDALAAVYNDAGIGLDEAGVSRLPALDQRGIAGATVAAASARIGDARSIWETGRLSRVNATGRALGADAGMTVPTFVDIILKNLHRLKK